MFEKFNFSPTVGLQPDLIFFAYFVPIPDEYSEISGFKLFLYFFSG